MLLLSVPANRKRLAIHIENRARGAYQAINAPYEPASGRKQSAAIDRTARGFPKALADVAYGALAHVVPRFLSARDAVRNTSTR